MTEHISTTRWTVDIELGERDGQTVARALLHTDDPTHLVGTGEAALLPDTYDVPEIGYEVAAGRALVALGSQLLAEATGDVEGVGGVGQDRARSEGSAASHRPRS